MYPAAASFSKTTSNPTTPNLNPSTTSPVIGSFGATNTLISRSTVISPLVAVNVNVNVPPATVAALIAVNSSAFLIVIVDNSSVILPSAFNSNACAADNANA